MAWGLGLLFLVASPSTAQVIPDSSSQTVVTPSLIDGLPSDLIGGGTVRGTTLFQSFQNFSVGEGRGAYFANPSGIQNILSRVTGGSASEIFGRVGVLGAANLYLINPSGILFGPNATLDLGGSFLASTADSIRMTDGSRFSAVDPQPVPLLTIGLPTSLEFSGNSGPIKLDGVGHILATTASNPFFTIGAGVSPTGLRSQPGNTIALIGGDVRLDGGIVTAPSGRIEVGSIAAGRINISPDSNGFALDYSSVESFKDIQLEKLSLLDASGGSGSISLQGKQIVFTDGSKAFIQNIGTQPAGTITARASDSLKLTGFRKESPFLKKPITEAQVRSGLLSQALLGQGADIAVSTRNLILESSGGLVATSFGPAITGGISVDASESIQLEGFAALGPLVSSSTIASATFGSGNASNIRVSTKALSIINHGSIISATFGSGSAGKVFVEALESVSVAGFSPVNFGPSIISSITFGPGDAGDLEISTGRLSVTEGARVDSSTLASGTAGSVTINALEQVEVKGAVPGVLNPSQITSSGNIVEPLLQQRNNLPSIPTGNAGSVSVTSPRLLISDGGRISVRNDGTGNAGEVRLNAKSIYLDHNGEITASTAGGNGGNIDLKFDDLLLLRNGSRISTSALGNGNGGNIVIDPDLVVLLGGSQISANADQGSGGLVSITTKGLLVSPDSSITAISNRGVEFNGVVEINASTQDFAKAAILPASPPQAPETSSVCQGRSGVEAGQLVKAGTGGIPRSPDDLLNKHSGWREQPSAAAVQVAVLDNPADPEVQGWIIYPDRTMQFTTEPGVFYAPSAALPCTTAKD